MPINTLRVEFDNLVIEENSASATYRKVFNILFEKKIISNQILQDFPTIVKDNPSEWSGQTLKAAVKISGSTNLYISSHSNTLRKKREIENIFAKYGLKGTVEVFDSENKTPTIYRLNQSSKPKLTKPKEVIIDDAITTLFEEPDVVKIVEIAYIKNKLAQAICIIGESGVGKSTRIKKTLDAEKHISLFVILDNMWQHILFDYSPKDREYTPTKIGHFIKDAFNDKENNYTIVIDECHKNLEIINDTLLQAISLERNEGERFLSLNSLIDEQFSFLPQKNGNRILPDNLGFIFISSKSDIIEGNDDLRNRIKIVELLKEDRDEENYSIDYLLRKIKTEEEHEYTN